MSGKNMMCSAHKAANEKSRKGWDRTFKHKPPVIKKIFVDGWGQTYYPHEVVFCDIDTPGPQFLGYVTRRTFKDYRNMNLWVRVKVREEARIRGRQYEIEEHEGHEIVAGVEYYKKT